uniref:Major facilitator superfamily transporter n=1 Tax=Vibrio algicola TaxID=2662262 RepID=A0A5Q0TK55_9VIBR
MSPTFPGLFRRTFKNENDFENAYPINYSVNNVGAFLSQYLFPIIVVVIGFHFSFAIAAFVAFTGFLVLYILRKDIVAISTDIDKAPIPTNKMIQFLVLSAAMLGTVFFMFSNMDVGQYIIYALALGAIGYFILLMLRAPKAEAMRMSTILLMLILVVAFFIYYGQMMTSMNMVAINTLRGDLFGFIPLPPEAAMALNPLWCMVAGPIITFIFVNLEKKGITFTTATKVGFAFIMTTLAFGTLTFAAQSVGSDAVIVPEYFFLAHSFQAFSEVIVGSLAVAFILSVTPKHIENFSVSLFSVAIALSGVVGAVFSTSIALDKGQKISQQFVQNTYGDYFQLLTILAVGIVAVAFICSILIKKILAASDRIERGGSDDEQNIDLQSQEV